MSDYFLDEAINIIHDLPDVIPKYEITDNIYQGNVKQAHQEVLYLHEKLVRLEYNLYMNLDLPDNWKDNEEED